MGALREPQSIDANPPFGESKRRARKLLPCKIAGSAETPSLIARHLEKS
jgi:hypothetical protein